MKMTIFFLGLLGMLNLYANPTLKETISKYPWTKGASDYKKECFNINKDSTYGAIIRRHCKVYNGVKSDKAKNIVLACPGGGLSPVLILRESEKECKNAK